MIRIRVAYEPLIHRPVLTRATVTVGGPRVSIDSLREMVPLQFVPRAQVGAGGAQTAAAGIVYIVAAGLEGAFAYALFTGKWIFKEPYPTWGVIFSLLTIASLFKAGDRMLASGGGKA